MTMITKKKHSKEAIHSFRETTVEQEAKVQGQIMKVDVAAHNT